MTSAAIPVFTTYPIPAWLTVGSQLQLDCQADGSPSPNITWLLDFEPINASLVDCTNASMTLNLAICSNGSLVIREVDFDDTGFYTCVADNGIGVNQVSVAVDVGVDIAPENVTGKRHGVIMCITNIDL